MTRIALFSYHPAPYRDPVFDKFHKLYKEQVLYKVYFARDVDVGHTYQQLESKGFNFEILDIKPKSLCHMSDFVRNYKRLGKLIKSEQFDVVLIPGHSDTFNMPLLHYCIKHKVPYILTSDSMSLNKTNPIRNFIKSIVEKRYIRHAASLYIPGKAGADFSIKMGAAPEAVFEGAYCLDAEELDRDADRFRSEREKTRKDLEIAPDEILLLFAGRFIDVCDFSTMLRAFSKAKKANPKIRLALFGGGYESDSIEKMICDEQIEGVQLHDFVPIREIAKYYVASDAYLMTYIWGNYSLACVQAAICRLPVITTDTLGAAYDVVADGETGILTPKSDIEATADAIIRIASLDSEARSRMGDAGRQLAIVRTPQWAAENLYKAVLYAVSK